jgi:methionine--tRNA ligase beta chain
MIPMLDTGKDAFEMIWEEQKENGRTDAEIDGMTGFVFCNRYGNIMNAQSVNRAIKRISSAYNATEEVEAKKHREPVLLSDFSAYSLDLSKVKIEPLFADGVDFETFSKSDFRVVKVKACEAVKKSKKLLQFTLDDGTGEDRTILSGIHEYYEPEELVGKTCVAITNRPPRKMMGIDSCGMLISAVYEYDGREGLNLLMLDDSIPAGAKLY